MHQLKRRLAGILTSLALIGGATAVTAAPAEAATYVAVINFKSGDIQVNGKTITPGHNVKRVNRNTMKVKLLYGCGWIQGLNKDGSRVKNRAYLRKGVLYSGGVFDGRKAGALDDGTANQFGVFDAACT